MQESFKELAKNARRRLVEMNFHAGVGHSGDNLTPADMYYGRSQAILDHRDKIKLKTWPIRRQLHYHNRTQNMNLMS